MEKTLNILALDGVIVMMTSLPSSNTPDILNTVKEPSLRVLIQKILARGRPSAEQLRES